MFKSVKHCSQEILVVYPRPRPLFPSGVPLIKHTLPHCHASVFSMPASISPGREKCLLEPASSLAGALGALARICLGACQGIQSACLTPLRCLPQGLPILVHACCGVCLAKPVRRCCQKGGPWCTVLRRTLLYCELKRAIAKPLRSPCALKVAVPKPLRSTPCTQRKNAE